MHEERISSILASLPESELLPELKDTFLRAGDVPRPDWDLPVLACLAVGGSEEAAVVGSAAVACLQISIILVDDMLDDDPKGEYHKLGYGPSANLALAFQSAALRVLDSDQRPIDIKSASYSCLARVALATAAGQNLDASNLEGEENYWRVIKAKSTPFYGGAMQLGGILGGAPRESAAALYDIGVIIGEIIQIEDDLNDSFEKPANPDWMAGRNNLLLLYASTAPHPDRELFTSLRYKVVDPAALDEAQKILISSGALSYSAFHLIERVKKAKGQLAGAQLVNPGPLEKILDDYSQSLMTFLKKCGVDIPMDLFV